MDLSTGAEFLAKPIVPDYSKSDWTALYYHLDWNSVIQFILALVGTISNLKAIFLIIYLLKNKWFNPDFIFLLVSWFNFFYCLEGIYNGVYSLRGHVPENYLEIAIMGIINYSYPLLYSFGLTMTAIEMWLAIRMPLWHRVHVSAKKVVFYTIITMVVSIGFLILPEIIKPGEAFEYYSSIHAAHISVKDIYIKIFVVIRFIIVSLGCMVTLVLAIDVFRIIKKRDPCSELPLYIKRMRSCRSRVVMVTFCHLTRFSFIWFIGVTLEIVFKDIPQLYLFVGFLFFMICIGDATLYFIMLPRYKKLKTDIVDKIAKKSKSSRILLNFFI